jgi:hypothetical protein
MHHVSCTPFSLYCTCSAVRSRHLHLTYPRRPSPKPYRAIHWDCARYIVFSYLLFHHPPILIVIVSGTASETRIVIQRKKRSPSVNVYEGDPVNRVTIRVMMKRYNGDVWYRGPLLLTRRPLPSGLCPCPHLPPVLLDSTWYEGRRLTSNDFLGSRPSDSSRTARCVRRGRMISQTRSWVRSSSMNSSKWVNVYPPDSISSKP